MPLDTTTVPATDLNERLYALADKVQANLGIVLTEEGTKNAFVMPFISRVLGYDVFNPLEVVPEFTADVGVKKGEKVDYAIVCGSEVQILIECKKLGDPLNLEHASQLFRYFATTDARLALLTNGQVYKFYTDLDMPNRMDAQPFLVLDLLDLDEALLPELQKLAKGNFDLDSIISAAGELKYIGVIKRVIAAEFKSPSDDWVRFFAVQAYEGTITQRVREQFRPLVAKATAQFLSDQVNDRLKAALGSTPASQVQTPLVVEVPETLADAPSNGIETTEEELEAYRIIKAIVSGDISPDRVIGRDAKSYFAVLVDNNRKPLVRLWFNHPTRRFIVLFDANKSETKIDITKLDDIYQYADTIRATARAYGHMER